MPGTRVRTTHTFAELPISQAAYDEIAGKLREADYHHVFQSDGTIDMTGIGLTASTDIENPAVTQVRADLDSWIASIQEAFDSGDMDDVARLLEQ